MKKVMVVGGILAVFLMTHPIFAADEGAGTPPANPAPTMEMKPNAAAEQPKKKAETTKRRAHKRTRRTTGKKTSTHRKPKQQKSEDVQK